MFVNRRQFVCGAAAGLSALAGCQGLGSSDGSPTFDPTATAEEFSISWESGPDLPNRRTQTTAVALDGRVYVIGGIVDDGDRAVAVYNPDERAWSTAAPPPKPVNHTTAVVYEGRIHLFGGYSGSFLSSPPLDGHWVYTPEDDRWRDAAPLPTARGALVAAVAGDRIFTIGGTSEEDTTGIVEVYDPDANVWHSASSMPTPRENLAAGVIDGEVYVAGGQQGLSPVVDAFERYDLESDTWAELPSLPTARGGLAAAALDGRVVVLGGESLEQMFEQVEVYRPATNSWTTVTPMPTPRWGLGAAAIGDSIYTAGGGAVPGGQETRTLEILSRTES
jgi:N-acetylneuraminic acid mutarotase